MGQVLQKLRQLSPKPDTYSRIFALLPIAVLLLLWGVLLYHLQIEWSVNPQYSYGWAVPFLCLYLSWEAWSRERKAEGGVAEGRERSGGATETPDLWNTGLLFALALCWFPVRLVGEANPDWRLVSWAMALITVGITLLLLPSLLQTLSRFSLPSPIPGYPSSETPSTADSSPPTDHRLPSSEPSTVHSQQSTPQSPSASPSTVHSPQPTAHSPPPTAFRFPILFFLVAVPWPTLLEGPLIQYLTNGNATGAVTILSAIGTPAIQHGNIIEVGTGPVGIDDACSGIRSFQATLMISLFLGQLYRFGFARRVSLVAAGFLLSFLCNLVRTTLLTYVAAKQGVPAIARWHDPAGVAILVACFIGLWLTATWLRGSTGFAETAVPESAGSRGFAETAVPESAGSRGFAEAAVPESTGSRGFAETAVPQPPLGDRRATLKTGLVLLLMLVFSELAVESWYRWHERDLGKPVTWSVQLPQQNASLREIPFSEKTKQFLRYDRGLNASWEDAQGLRWQAIFLEWDPGSIGVHVAKSHTPEVCLSAAGRTIVSKSDTRILEMNGLSLPVQLYTLQEPTGPLHVLYCYWQDRAASVNRNFDTTSLTYQNRFAPVLAGQRNLGQRSLELVVWGAPDDTAAMTDFQAQLGKMVER